MSKSATEQFQIKTKRKIINNKNNENSINRSGGNNIFEINNKKSHGLTAASIQNSELHLELQQQQQQIQQHYVDIVQLTHLSDKRKNFDFHYKNYFAPEPIIIIDDDDDADARIVDFHIRDKVQVVAKKMPLSQGFYSKGALATKRNSRAVKLCGRDDMKRKTNENSIRNNSSHNVNTINNNNNYLFNDNNNTKANVVNGFCDKNNSKSFSAHKASKGATIAQKQLQQHLLHSAQRTNNNNNNNNNNYSRNNNFNSNNQNIGSASNLQLSYLLAESLARYGRLQEAFDIYAIIASEQLDNSIPLERLNTLAITFINYVRQLSSNHQQNDTGNNPAKIPQNVADLTLIESTNHKSKIAKTSTSWQNAKVCAATQPTTIFGNNLDLNDTTRVLFIPSPTLSEDYDPLMCPLCRDVLRCPVTTNCGHTFCRQCCEQITQCNICQIKFTKNSLDELVSDANVARQFYATGTLSNDVMQTAPTPTASLATLYGNNVANSFTNFNGLRNNNMLSNLNVSANILTSALNSRLQHQIDVASPLTVTTTAVALTTPTATTTMASTSATTNAVASSNNMKFMPDVLVRRLVEKWWGADLQAKKINETATSYMHLNLLDDALKFCNASLEKSPANFKSQLLRAEVLRKLNHLQSSLADVDNALKSRYTSAKAHYLRALALNGLGRVEEALFENSLAISLDKSYNLTNSELFQHDLTKTIQKLLAQSPKYPKISPTRRNFNSTSPYNVWAEHRMRRKEIALLSKGNRDHLSSYMCDDDDDFVVCAKECDIIADVDDYVLGGNLDEYTNCKDNRGNYAHITKDYEAVLRRHTTCKHFRRKWMIKETELVPTAPNFDEMRCSVMFRNILDRTQQEVQRLRKLASSGESTSKQLAQIPASLIDASDFDCVLCCRTFWKPVVTPCGHTYCWVCLDRCMDYNPSCPLCMSPLVEPNVNQCASSPVPFILAKRPITKFLEAAMKRFIPDSYEKRFRQEMNFEPTVPVFICTTAFPYVPCPLFVYEPRYRLMVRRAVESGEKQFGIVQPTSGKSRYFDIGTILDIRDCVLLGDGCFILSTIGCKRFKILARNEKDGYETAKVEYIYDENISDENVNYVSTMHSSVLSKSIEWFDSLSTELKQEIFQSFGEMPPVEDNWVSIADGPAWAWWIIALLPLSQQLKVDILATTSLEKRLRAIEKTLDYMSGTFRRAQQDCNVVVVQQQQQHQQRQEQEEEDCDNELSATDEECCQRTTNATNSLTASGTTEQHSTTNEHPPQLML